MAITDSISIPPLKRCSRCKNEYPATAEYFNRLSKSKDGLQFRCRDCQAIADKRVPVSITQKSPELKSCVTCGIIYPNAEVYFYPNKINRDGKTGTCRACVRTRGNRWRLANPDRVKENHRRHYDKNKSRYSSRGHENYLANREVYIGRAADWRTSNAGRYRFHMRMSQNRRRARKVSLPNTFTEQDWIDALNYFDHRCAVCGRQQDLFCKLVADHWIALSKGGGSTPDNLVPMCDGFGGCNESKNNRDAQNWLTERYGQRKAEEILKRVLTYFKWVTSKS